MSLLPNKRFTITSRDKKSLARCGQLVTPHGIIQTPCFVPVGTQASIKSLTPDELKTLGVSVFFVNTYHMYLRPGVDIIRSFGGLHPFMGWDGPLMTDSGGFQVFSLGKKRNDNNEAGKLVSIDKDGVTFTSHWDGSTHRFTPELSLSVQHILGADLILSFDECTPYPATAAFARESLTRTHNWAVRSLYEHQKRKTTQLLFGIVQGSVYEDLRKESAQFISSLPFDAIAIGGLSVGETKEEMRRVCDWVVPLLPDEKPRHLLGVGEIDDIFESIERGVDMFDCVMPTRLGRMGRILVNAKCKMQNAKSRIWEIDINKKIFATDRKPLDSGCTCYTCSHFSRAYLHHLFRVRELLAYRLATLHNLHFIQALLSDIRNSIPDGTFLALKKKWLYNMDYMGSFGGFYKGEKKKQKKKDLSKKGQTYATPFVLPTVEIIGKGKKPFS